jgi:hypothetical protein
LSDHVFTVVADVLAFGLTIPPLPFNVEQLGTGKSLMGLLGKISSELVTKELRFECLKVRFSF